MEKNFKLNQIILPPHLLVDESKIIYSYIGFKKLIVSEKYLPDEKQLKRDGTHHLNHDPDSKFLRNQGITRQPLFVLEKETKKVIAESVEGFLMQMVAQCALQVHLPSLSSLPSPSVIKKELTPTARKSIKFLDYRHTLWKAIIEYLVPIRDSVKLDKKVHPYEPSSVYRLGWNIYMLILGKRTQSQIIMSPELSVDLINMFLTKSKKLSREAKARLLLLKGIFSSFELSPDIGGFQIVSGASMNLVSDRLEEIVEDAYLLEASALRRFFGINSNKASIRRDLRKLVNFISKNRPWAKGLLKSTKHVGYFGSQAALSELIDVIPGNISNNYTPVCISPISHLQSFFSSLTNKDFQRDSG